MQSLTDFLSFKLFISPYVLIICYYMGAIATPFASWLLARWIKGKLSLTSDVYESGKKQITQLTNPNSRILLITLFIFFFISIEIIWRMMFEFLIAYLQMREAIMELVTKAL